MMSLRNLLFSGSVPDPFSRRFSWQPWQTYLAGEQPSEEDRALYKSARTMRGCVDAFLANLGETAYRRENRWAVIEALIMFANARSVRLRREAKNVTNSDDMYIGFTPRFEGAAGYKYDMNDIHTFTTDGVALALGDLLSRSGNPPATFSFTDTAAADADKILELAVAWNSVKHTWQLCLYHAYQSEENDQEVHFQGGSDQGYFILARHRGLHENLTDYMFFRQMEMSEKKGSYERAVFERNGFDLRLAKNRTKSIDADSLGLEPFLREYVLPSVLDAPSGVTVADVLSAWELLADAAIFLLDRASDEEISDETVACDLEGRVARISIVTMLMTALRATKERAETILHILMHKSGASFNPWATPIVDRGDGTVMMLLGVFCWANRSFAIESILKACRYDMDARGPALESFVKKELERALLNCEFRSIVFVSSPGLNLRAPDNNVEEIDLLLAVGRDLYIVEVKATLFPVAVEDDHFLKQKLIGAGEQLSRKIEFVQKNLAHITRMHPTLASLRPKPSNVRGVVVTNFAAGSAPWSNYPIIDVGALASYFGQGASFGRIEVESGVLKDVDPRMTVTYYNSYATFREHFPRYLEYSPHANAFAPFLERTATKFPLGKFGLKDFVVAMPDLVLPDSAAELNQRLVGELDRLRSFLWHH
jgi:hypothetical protein